MERFKQKATLAHELSAILGNIANKTPFLSLKEIESQITIIKKTKDNKNW
jgi:hypothetical protein